MTKVFVQLKKKVDRLITVSFYCDNYDNCK